MFTLTPKNKGLSKNSARSSIKGNVSNFTQVITISIIKNKIRKCYIQPNVIPIITKQHL